MIDHINALNNDGDIEIKITIPKIIVDLSVKHGLTVEELLIKFASIGALESYIAENGDCQNG
jgi:hypothetical protein